MTTIRELHGALKFPDCIDCVHRGKKATCAECDCGELFEEKDQREPLDFEDTR